MARFVEVHLFAGILLLIIPSVEAGCRNVKVAYTSTNPEQVYVQYVFCGTRVASTVKLTDSAATVGTKTFEVEVFTVIGVKYDRADKVLPVSPADSVYVVEVYKTVKPVKFSTTPPDRDAELNCNLDTSCTCPACSAGDICQSVEINHFCDDCTLLATFHVCKMFKPDLSGVEHTWMHAHSQNLTKIAGTSRGTLTLKLLVGSELRFDYFYNGGTEKGSLENFVIKHEGAVSCDINANTASCTCSTRCPNS